MIDGNTIKDFILTNWLNVFSYFGLILFMSLIIIYPITLVFKSLFRLFIPKPIEETVINSLINSGKYKDINIIVYGLNCNDLSIHPKVKQLKSLGFYKVFIYIGGLFEWLLLQDIYGQSNFQTTSVEKDLLKYKPSKIF